MKKMKKIYMIMAMICLVLAIVCMVLNIMSVKPRVSKMSDWRLRLFLRQYGLDQYDGADNLPAIRAWAYEFEVYHHIMLRTGFVPKVFEPLEDALADYYGIIPATVPHKSDNPIYS